MTFVGVNEIRQPNVWGPVKERSGKLPSWFKVKIRQGPDYREIRRIMDEQGLHTICEEARCPNVWECWNNRTATFLILGDICTRRCHYCAVTTGRPGDVDVEEPMRVAEAISKLGLRHAVITSVNRDELPDGGASIFAETSTSSSTQDSHVHPGSPYSGLSGQRISFGRSHGGAPGYFES